MRSFRLRMWYWYGKNVNKCDEQKIYNTLDSFYLFVHVHEITYFIFKCLLFVFYFLYVQYYFQHIFVLKIYNQLSIESATWNHGIVFCQWINLIPSTTTSIPSTTTTTVSTTTILRPCIWTTSTFESKKKS